MSWNSGSQPAITESAELPKARRIISSLWRRLPWLTITPFGMPVEPEVYWRKARASAPGAAMSQSGSGTSAASAASQVARARAGTCSFKVAARARVAAVVSTTRGRQSSATACSRGSGRLTRGG